MAWDTGLERDTPAYYFAIEEARNIRVLAGPGTGKSFGLRRRVARLLEDGTNPKRILAVTFTRTAAQDLCNEIQSIEVEGANKVIAKTLHSFCFQLLQKNDIITQTGRYPRPVIEHEQKPMLYDLMGDYGGLKEREKKLRAFEAAWARLQSEEPGYPKEDIDRQFSREIRQWLVQHRAMLFGEMIIEAYHYLRDNPQCFERHMLEHKAPKNIVRYVNTGIENYVSGRYGSQSTESSVIGYVLSGRIPDIVDNLKTEIQKQAPISNLSRVMTTTEPQYKTKHKRTLDNEDITLHHLFFNFGA